jgi:hypothetical protein
MGMGVAVSEHQSCDEYFSVLYEALTTIMQKVYADLDEHDQTLLAEGYVQPWSDKIAEVAEGRWIDSLFAISALMTISTQLSYAKSSGNLCSKHATPFLKLSEAASVNIATYLINDSQIHLASLMRGLKLDIPRENLPEVKSMLREQALSKYLSLIDNVSETVEKQSSTHSLEMVFSQFRFKQLVGTKWTGKMSA